MKDASFEGINTKTLGTYKGVSRVEYKNADQNTSLNGKFIAIPENTFISMVRLLSNVSRYLGSDNSFLEIIYKGENSMSDDKVISKMIELYQDTQQHIDAKYDMLENKIDVLSDKITKIQAATDIESHRKERKEDRRISIWVAIATVLLSGVAAAIGAALVTHFH